MNHTLLRGLTAAAALLCALPAAASGDAVYSWSAPSAQAQLAADSTAVPAGKGALFIPSITGAALEPDVLVVDGDRVSKVPIGRRVALAPGRYVVVVGSSNPRLATGVPVEVQAGRTALVPVRWGALRVEVVDTRLNRRDAAFTLVHAESGREVTVPARLDPQSESTTWLLEPGLYRLFEPGRDRLSSPDFVTVHVPEGGLANFRLFVDRSTGDFRGGGVVPLAQTLPDPRDQSSPWRNAMVVGVDASAAQTRHQVGFPDQTIATGTLFIDADVDYTSGLHTFQADLEVEQGQQYISLAEDSALPLIKAADHLGADLLYSLNLNDGVGLYVRGESDSQVFDTWALATEDTRLAIRQPDGSVRSRSVDAGERYQVASGWSPTTLQGGAGLRFRFVDTGPLTISVRVGPGLRSNRFGGALLSEDNARTPELELTRLESFDQRGLEGTAVIDGRLTGWFTLSGELHTFFGWQALDQPLLELDGEANFRLTKVLSFNYLVAVSRFPQVTDTLQVRHAGFLRASWSLL